MSFNIKLKRSATQNAIPSVDSMELGEIAVNTYDGRIFIKTYDGEFSIKRVISEEELADKLANGDYTVAINPDSLGLVFGNGLEVTDDNKLQVKLGPGLEFTDDGAITLYKFPLELVDNWQTRLSELEQFTFNISYDGDNYHIVDGGRDTYDNGNYIKVNDNNLSYTRSIYKSAGFLLFGLTDVFGIKFWGNNGADGDGQVLNETNLILDNTKEIYTSYKVIQNGRGGDPAIHHIVFSNKSVSQHKVASSTDNDYDEYSFSELSDVYLMVMWSNSTVAWDNGNLPLSRIYNALFG